MNLGRTNKVVIVQSLSHVWLFATPWTEAHQASLSLIISWSLPKFMSIESVMPSNHLFSVTLSPSAFNLSLHQGLFQWVGSSHQVAKVLELQHQFFQWIFRVDFLRIDWLASLYPARLRLCEDVFYTHEWQVGPVYQVSPVTVPICL